MNKEGTKQNSNTTSKSSVKRQRVNFSFVGDDVQEISLAGDFNNWNPEAHPMKRDKYGIWKKDVIIPPGEYEYKFLVDGNWTEDPKNDQKNMNCFGTFNSVLNLSPPQRT